MKGLGLTAAAILLLLSPAGSARAEEEGKGSLAGAVIRQGTGAAGILVEVHLERRKAGGTAPAAAAESGEDGTFVFSLPPGEYFLSAKLPPSRPGPPAVFEHPRSPFVVRAGERTEAAPLELPAGTAAEAPPPAGLTGRVLMKGEPVPGAFIMLYDEAAGRPMGPRYAGRVESGPDGRFQGPALPGNYLVAVRKRRRPAAFGPLQPGDLAAEYEGNPVRVEDGRFTDMGDIALHAVDPEKLLRRLESLDRPASGAFSIRGRVVGPEGDTLPGHFVFLYGNAEMTGPPLSVTRSGQGGEFVLNPPGTGRYYVIARETYGAARTPGEQIGVIEGSPDSSVGVEEGEAASGLVVKMSGGAP